jgi:hypothetical protein
MTVCLRETARIKALVTQGQRIPELFGKTCAASWMDMSIR